MADDTLTHVPPPSDPATDGTGPSGSGALGPGSGRVVHGLWLPAPVRRRLVDLDATLVDDVGADPDLILVSSRGPAARRPSIAALSERAPVVVVCHPGGEGAAAELVRYGASTVIAEGAEGLAFHVLEDRQSSHLVDAYAGEMDRTWSGVSTFTIDPVTGLPTTSGFELTLAEIGKDGTIPRLGLIRLALDGAERAIGAAATQAVKRRLTAAVAGAAAHAGAEVFDLGGMLAFVAPSMSSAGAAELGQEIVHIAASYAPTGEPLRVAVGTAGIEAASDIESLRLLAERALRAAEARDFPVVGADELSRHSAAAVELGAAVAVAAAVDSLDPRGDHSTRMADYVAAICRELQLDPDELAAVGLAARLHDIGKLTFGRDAFDESSPGFAQARAEHPQRGERYLRSGAGQEVALIVRGHHESWDGGGFPDGLAGQEIPLGARILAVAHAYDELVSAGVAGSALESGLRDLAGTTLDPDLVEATILLFAAG